MVRHLTDIQKLRIVSKIEDGWSIRRLAAEYNVSKTTIMSVKKQWETNQTVSRKVGSGRPRKSNNQEDENLINYLRENPFQTAVNAISETNFPASVPTACRRIKLGSELKSCSAAKKYKLAEEKKQGRIIFALNYIINDENFWGQVVFSDEKVFKSCNDGHVRVYRPPSTRYDEKYTFDPQISGRFSVNVWAWMSLNGLGVCWNSGGHLNSIKYIEILDNIMLPSVIEVFPENNFIFQQDNCSIHTAHRVRQWFLNKNIELIPWPSKSPDLNPIENVWGLMVKHIRKLNNHPNNAQELEGIIEDAWENSSQEVDLARNLILSMPARLQAVLDANGAMTKY